MTGPIVPASTSSAAPLFAIVEVDLDGGVCLDDATAVRGPVRFLVIVRRRRLVLGTFYTDEFSEFPGGEELRRLAIGYFIEMPPVREVPDAKAVLQLSRHEPAVVLICTYNNPDGIALLLESVGKQTATGFRVVVVDNAPRDESVHAVVQRFVRDRSIDVQYIVERRAGLSHARNAGLRAVSDPQTIVCWLDDDEVVEPEWMEGILRAFADVPEAWAVSGAVLPAELGTQAQQLFELYGGHSKGRAFAREVITKSTVDPLIPLPPFGVGANMAAYAWVYDRVGSFDEALGAGTAVKGGEDTLFFTQVLLLGGVVVYEPSAVTRHRHRRTMAELEAQFLGYGRGLSAFYVALLFWRPRIISSMLRSIPSAVVALRTNSQRSAVDMGISMPAHILRLKRRGFLEGPYYYIHARLVGFPRRFHENRKDRPTDRPGHRG